MKKILCLTSVLALAACGFSNENVAEHDADFAKYNCERIAKSAVHLVYKCPADLDWVKEIKKQEPNTIFKSGHGFDWDVVNADTEHVLIEVAQGGEGCKENFHYRTMIKPINKNGENYAFKGCK